MKLSKSIKPISHEQTQESLALLKMLAQSTQSIQEGRFKPYRKAFADIRKRVRDANK